MLALAAAREAGQITLEYFRRDDLDVERKADDSPVTVADRRAEEHLRSRIAAAFAGDAILGEEMPERPGSSPFRWILDPIDGTKSFIHGVPLYGTLVGVEHEGEPVLGVIRIPALDECVYAARGQGAWYVQARSRRGRPGSRSGQPLAQGLFLTSEVATFDEIGRRDVYDRLQAAARLDRYLGRLLRLPDGGHGPGRGDGRSDRGRLGPRPAAAHPGGGRRHASPTGKAGGRSIPARPSPPTACVLEEVLAVTRGA